MPGAGSWPRVPMTRCLLPSPRLSQASNRPLCSMWVAVKDITPGLLPRRRCSVFTLQRRQWLPLLAHTPADGMQWQAPLTCHCKTLLSMWPSMYSARSPQK